MEESNILNTDDSQDSFYEGSGLQLLASATSEQKLSRKTRSLSSLTDKFVEKFSLTGCEIRIDEAAKCLDVEKRRIYDIVNVFQTIGYVDRKAKNIYVWRGSQNLIPTLTSLKMEIDQRNTQISTAKEDSTDLEDSDNKKCALGFICKKLIQAFIINKFTPVSFEQFSQTLLEATTTNITDATPEKNSLSSSNAQRRTYDIANVLSSIKLVQRTRIPASQNSTIPNASHLVTALMWTGPSLNKTSTPGSSATGGGDSLNHESTSNTTTSTSSTPSPTKPPLQRTETYSVPEKLSPSKGIPIKKRKVSPISPEKKVAILTGSEVHTPHQIPMNLFGTVNTQTTNTTAHNAFQSTPKIQSRIIPSHAIVNPLTSSTNTTNNITKIIPKNVTLNPVHVNNRTLATVSLFDQSSSFGRSSNLMFKFPESVIQKVSQRKALQAQSQSQGQSQSQAHNNPQTPTYSSVAHINLMHHAQMGMHNPPIISASTQNHTSTTEPYTLQNHPTTIASNLSRMPLSPLSPSHQNSRNLPPIHFHRATGANMNVVKLQQRQQPISQIATIQTANTNMTYTSADMQPIQQINSNTHANSDVSNTITTNTTTNAQ